MIDEIAIGIGKMGIIPIFPNSHISSDTGPRHETVQHKTQKEQPIQCVQFATTRKITLNHWLFFLAHLPYLELRLVLDPSKEQHQDTIKNRSFKTSGAKLRSQ